MTYNTGNALGSSDPRDLHDNAANLDIAVNSAATTFTDRLGGTKLTVAGMASAAGDATIAINAAQQSLTQADRAQSISDAMEQTAEDIALAAAQDAVAGVSTVVQQAQAARDAAQLSAGVYATTAAGLAATTTGEYFSVPSAVGTEYLILYKNNSGAALEVKRYPSSLVTAINLNAGKPYPLRSVSRDGLVSSEATAASNAILDIKVIGARQGKYYRLEYIANGVEFSGAPRYDWLWAEYDAATYSTDSASKRKDAVALTDLPALSAPPSGIITRTFKSPRLPGVVFVVTYNSAALGSSVVLNSSGFPGYSWIIDENCYVYAGEIEQLPIEYAWRGDILTAAFPVSKTHDLALTVGRRGVNQLYDFSNIRVAPNVGAPAALNKVYTTLYGSSTDWIGPYQVAAAAGGTAGAPLRFTGGNHGSNGDDTGSPTAEHVSVEVAIDGTPLRASESRGRAKEIVIRWTNNVRAYNTQAGTAEARFVLREITTARIASGGVQVHHEIVALEAVNLYLYYGLQAHTGGFDSSVHFVNGQQGARFTPDGVSNYISGAKSSYPEIPVIATRGSYGDFWMWLDGSYGMAASRSVDSANSLALYQTTKKAYHVLINTAAGLALASGGRLKWRGGYAWGESLGAGAPIDSALRYMNGNQVTYGAIFNATGTGQLSPVAHDANAKVSYSYGSGDGYVPSERMDLTSPGYGLVELTID